MPVFLPTHLIDHWQPRASGAPHARLDRLLVAIEPEADRDTLGARNHRLLALHAAAGGGALEAQVTCAACGVINEFPVPTAAITASPAAQADAVASVGESRFRLPLMRELLGPAGQDPRAIADACRIAGTGALDDEVLDALGDAFEAADPAATIVVTIACAGCAAALAATVDLAGFVAQALDRIVDGLLRDIDVIASAYGWREAEILALPPERRRHYVALIVQRRLPSATPLERWG